MSGIHSQDGAAAAPVCFVDAAPALAAAIERLRRDGDPAVRVHRDPDVDPSTLPDVLGRARIAIVDHTNVPTEVAARCEALTDIVFLGTGARSYMDPDALARLGIDVHLIRGYGDVAVAECAFALMWATARRFGEMDRAMRAGRWLRLDARQLTGKTLGLLGVGGIGREMARLASGVGMTVLGWNRTPRDVPGVRFVDLPTLLGESDVLSVHLLLTDETRGFLDRERLAAMKPGALLINTARGAIVDEAAMVDALKDGRLGGAGLDVFTTEPLPDRHPLAALPNVVLSAHSAFRTPEATDRLIEAALDHCRRLVGPPAAPAAPV